MLRVRERLLPIVSGCLLALSLANPAPVRALLAATLSPPPQSLPVVSLAAAPVGASAGGTDAVPGVSVSSVKNLRPVVPGSSLYRSATLDDLTQDDAERLLSGSAFAGSAIAGEAPKPLAAVIDLRNADEIAKGKGSRTEASKRFYDSQGVVFATVPVLGNVDAFWEEAIASMEPGERWMATLRTAVVGGALDKAAARHLERGGLPLLYSITMKTGGRPLAEALDACLEASASSGGGPVVFHCQKGKDRTGILSMLLQECLGGSTDRDMVESYALSGSNIGELPNQTRAGDGGDSSSSSSSTIDWSYFRGSPASAMEDTLAWTRRNYGSVEGYLDSICFGEEKRAQLRKHCLR